MKLAHGGALALCCGAGAQVPPCQEGCFDAMVAVNWANFSSLGTSGDSDCFSLVTSERSVSGVGCSYITYSLELVGGLEIEMNFTSSPTTTAPFFAPKIDGSGLCDDAMSVSDAQFTSHCTSGGAYALNIFMQKSQHPRADAGQRKRHVLGAATEEM